MHYFMHLELISAVAKNSELVLEVEFTPACQMDGREPSHGDLQLDFAETIIRSLPRKPIADALEGYDIGSAKNTLWRIEVTNTGRLCESNFCPLFHLRMSCPLIEYDSRWTGMAEQLLKNVNCHVLKAAIADSENRQHTGE